MKEFLTLSYTRINTDSSKGQHFVAASTNITWKFLKSVTSNKTLQIEEEWTLTIRQVNAKSNISSTWQI